MNTILNGMNVNNVNNIINTSINRVSNIRDNIRENVIDNIRENMIDNINNISNFTKEVIVNTKEWTTQKVNKYLPDYLSDYLQTYISEKDRKISYESFEIVEISEIEGDDL